jgi:hypothetical protein
MNKLQAFYIRIMKYHDIDKTIKHEITKDYEFIKNHYCMPTDDNRLQNEGIKREGRNNVPK